MADKATCESDQIAAEVEGKSTSEVCGHADRTGDVPDEKIERASPSLTDAPPPVEEKGECPPPLAWSDVLSEVREQSQAIESTGRCGRLTGRKFGEGPSLYFLNGLAGNWELFVLTLWLLRADFCCRVVDLPQERRRFSAEDLAADLFQLADEQGDERFSLFATSYAVLPAFAAMIAQPQRIRKAVIHAGFARRQLSLSERLLLGVGKVFPLSLRRTPFVQRIQRINHKSWFPPFDESRWQFFLDNTGPVKVASIARWISALRKCDFTERLHRISSPVLLIATEGESSFAEKERNVLQSGLPNARVEKLPHCGLLPFLTHPHILSKSLRTFLLDKPVSAE